MPGAAKPSAPRTVFFGTYTDERPQGAKGVYRARFDPADGRLSRPELAAAAVHPSFLARHPARPWLYAVGETAGDSAQIHAFLETGDGGLRPLNSETIPAAGPCHLCVCADAGPNAAPGAVAAACYAGGAVAVLPLLPDGRLGPRPSIQKHEGRGPHPARQTAPHAHGVYWRRDPDGAGRLHVPDLGLDAVFRYDLEPADAVARPPASGRARYALPAGCGPRHLAFFDSRAGARIYSVNELDATVCVLADGGRDGDPPMQTLSSLPDGVDADACGNASGEIALHPDGRWLYVSNRGHDSLTRFDVDPADGRLARRETTPAGGRHPRSFAISPCGNWMIVAHRDDDSLAVFRVEPDGRPTPAGPRLSLGKPVCVLFA